MTKTIKIGFLFLSIFLLTIISIYAIKQTFSVFHETTERKLPIYCVDTDQPKISISFDAAWGNEDTADILSILRKYNIKATFFMTGGWVD